MKLSVVIPAHNEEAIIEETVTVLTDTLAKEKIEHEIIVVNDCSADSTEAIVAALQKKIPCLLLSSTQKSCVGFGHAVQKGFDLFTGDCVALFMADLSDSPDDLVRFFRTMEIKQTDCVFGSRFIKGGKVNNYPLPKLLLNRLSNTMVCFLFGIRYNDCTNAFKLYSRKTIEALRPFWAEHFNLTLELPLKAIIRKHTYSVIPTTWNGRKTGTSTFRIKEMGSKYFFVLIKCLKEKYGN